MSSFKDRTSVKMMKPPGLTISSTSTTVGRLGKIPTVAVSPLSP